MNYEYIEKIVLQAKAGDTEAKELLVAEFNSLIMNLSKKSFITSYEPCDIRNECYKTLFKCVRLYNPDKHRFVAYATNAIKNSINHLIRTSVRRTGAEGSSAFILDSSFQNTISTANYNILESLIVSEYNSKLRSAMKNLNVSDKELLSLVYFKGCSLKKYSEIKGITYYTALKKRNNILCKLENALAKENINYYPN